MIERGSELASASAYLNANAVLLKREAVFGQRQRARKRRGFTKLNITHCDALIHQFGEGVRQAVFRERGRLSETDIDLAEHLAEQAQSIIRRLFCRHPSCLAPRDR